jgi:histidine triad (HIT) family protein
MRDDCRYCQLIESIKQPKVYEDEKIVVMMDSRPAAKGQVIILPREHHPIMELVPDFVIDNMFRTANKLSMVLFDQLKATGTNILVQNGIPAGQDIAHFSIMVIPRKDNDGLDLTWQPRQLSEEEMSTIELSYNEETKTVGQFEKEKEKPIEIDKPKEDVKIESKSEDDYKLKQLRRIPRW